MFSDVFCCLQMCVVVYRCVFNHSDVFWQLLHQPIGTLLWCHVVSVWVSTVCSVPVLMGLVPAAGPPLRQQGAAWRHERPEQTQMQVCDHMTSHQRRTRFISDQLTVRSEPRPEPSMVTDVWSIYIRYIDLIFTSGPILQRERRLTLQLHSDSTAAINDSVLIQLIMNWSHQTHTTNCWY